VPVRRLCVLRQVDCPGSSLDVRPGPEAGIESAPHLQLAVALLPAGHDKWRAGLSSVWAVLS
jgi:hypothetical protein